MMPESQRDQLVDATVASVKQVMQSMVASLPQLDEALAEEPRAAPIFQRFLQRQVDAARTSTEANMPDMIEALTTAYARRFTPEQMAEMEVFFATPTGQAYIAESSKIMTDPAVAAWQQKVMAADMARMPAEVERMMDELKALGALPTTNGI